jgi:hypothetical protein
MASSKRQHQIPTSPTLVDGFLVHPVRSVRNVGIHIDADLIMGTHVIRTVSRCFAVLRQVRRSVPMRTFHMLISAFILTRLYYTKSVQYAGWCTSIPCSAAAVGFERFSMSYLRTSATRPRARRAHQASLGEDSGADQFQIRSWSTGVFMGQRLNTLDHCDGSLI